MLLSIGPALLDHNIECVEAQIKLSVGGTKLPGAVFPGLMNRLDILAYELWRMGIMHSKDNKIGN